MYPVRYEADYLEPQSRAKAFFRLILAIPWLVLANVYSIAAFIVAILAWFAVVFTARYPQGLFNFNMGFVRFAARTYAFLFLQTEQYPPFGFEQDPSYQVRVENDPPLERYNRWKALFRLIVGIPVLFMVSLMAYLYQLAAGIAWFQIVFMGRTSGGVHNALSTGLAYQMRTNAYFLLLTETLPPVSDQAPAPNVPAAKPKPKPALPKAGATASAASKPKAAAKPKQKAPAKSKAPAKPKVKPKPAAKPRKRS